jgi:hypothetical protein
LLVPVAETGINGLYKPGLKAFFPPVLDHAWSTKKILCKKIILSSHYDVRQSWCQQIRLLADLGNGNTWKLAWGRGKVPLWPERLLIIGIRILTVVEAALDESSFFCYVKSTEDQGI